MSEGPLSNSTRSIGMLVNKSLPYRQPHDLQIEPDGPMLNVIQVELIPFFKRGVATPATDLRPPCNTSFHLLLSMYRGICFRTSSTTQDRSGRGPTMLISPFRTFQNCGSSSKLVDRMTPDRCYAGIILLSQQPMIASMIRAHCTELDHHERLSIQPHALLFKRTGPGEVSLISNATNSSTGSVRRRAIKLPIKSLLRLRIMFHP